MVLEEVAGHAPPPAVATLVVALTAPDPAQRPESAAAALRLLDGARAPTAPTNPIDATAATQRAAPAATVIQPGSRGGSEDAALRPPAAVLSRPYALPLPLALLATLAALGVILAVVLASGGASEDRSSQRTAPGPAPPGAPLDQQLRALQRIIDDAAQPPPQ